MFLVTGAQCTSMFPKAPLLLVTGAVLPCSSPHRGSSKPRRSVTSHPSSSRTPPREILHPFHSGGPLSHSDSWLAWKLQKALALTCKIQNKSNPFLPKVLFSWSLHTHAHPYIPPHSITRELLLNVTVLWVSAQVQYQEITDQKPERINKINKTLHLFWQFLGLIFSILK